MYSVFYRKKKVEIFIYRWYNIFKLQCLKVQYIRLLEECFSREFISVNDNRAACKTVNINLYEKTVCLKVEDWLKIPKNNIHSTTKLIFTTCTCQVKRKWWEMRNFCQYWMIRYFKSSIKSYYVNIDRLSLVVPLIVGNIFGSGRKSFFYLKPDNVRISPILGLIRFTFL